MEKHSQLEGSFQASDRGRVKSLDRIVDHTRLKKKFIKGQTLNQSVAKSRNIGAGEPLIIYGREAQF